MANISQFGPSGPPLLADGTYPPPTFPGIPSQASMLVAVDKLKFFLATAPSRFDSGPYDTADSVAREERCLNRFQLPTGELISCVLWNGLYHVTGTDIVRVLHFRFAAFGRPVRNPKKFEEGIFSDLRNLKSGTDATLEEPKSEFLELLFKYNCIRTQKKQKVFYWFSVPHDRLFLDALDRDLKREKLGVEPTTEAVAEPALSFVYNPAKSLYEQFTEQQAANDADAAAAARAAEAATAAVQEGKRRDGSDPPPGVIVTEPEAEGSSNLRHKRRPSQIATGGQVSEMSGAVQEADGSQVLLVTPSNVAGVYRSPSGLSTISSAGLSAEGNWAGSAPHSASSIQSQNGVSQSQSAKMARTFSDPQANAIFGAFALFEGSPTYKQRRKPGQKRGASGAMPPPTPRRQESSPGVLSHSSVSSMLGQGSFDDDIASSRPNSSSGLGAPSISGLAHSHSPVAISYPSAMTGDSLYPPVGPHQDHHSAPLSGTHSNSSTGGGSIGGHYLEERTIARPALDVTIPQNEMEEGGQHPARTYVCPLHSCARQFKRLEHLKRHYRIHTEEKPYPCTLCDKKFARSDNLAAHLKIHEKMAARAGSASSADQRALEAEEELEPRHSHSESPPSAVRPPSSAPYFSNYQAGLPTPPTGYSDHPQWGYQYQPGGAHLLTPDQSPDPSSMYGQRQGSLSVFPQYPGQVQDPRRFRSATPASTHVVEGFPRHASAGPPVRSYSSSDIDYNSSISSVSPMISSFQQQLNMVNSLHDEMKSQQAMQGDYMHPSYASQRNDTVGLGLSASYEHPGDHASMPPPTHPASSYEPAPLSEVHRYSHPHSTVSY